MLERCLYWRGIRVREVSVLERYPTVLEWCLYWRDIRVREVSV